MSTDPRRNQTPSNVVRSTFRDDPEMREIVLMFVNELPARTQAFTDAWNSRRLDDLRRLAHQLRGCGACYGFAPLGDAAGRVEESLRDMRVPEADEVDHLRLAVEELIDLCRRVAP